MEHLLCLILLAPVIGTLLILMVPAANIRLIRAIAKLSVFASLAAAVAAFVNYDPAAGGYQMSVLREWAPSLGLTFHLGIDGVSTVLVLLHALCAFAGTLVSNSINVRVKEYLVFYLLLITGVYGVFLSLDVFFFYLFYEMAVVPMFPLIAIWGGDVKDEGRVRFTKEYATMKLTLYLTLGAVVALIALLWMYAQSGAGTFNLPRLQAHLAENPLDARLQWVLFPMIAIGFGVIAKLWPFHSWSPIGYAAAPPAVSMLHAGVLMKLGSYAIFRIALPLLPQGALGWLPVLAAAAVIGILYSGIVAMKEKDLKLIIGYSSCSHTGYILLGLACVTALSMSGAIMLIFAHGIMTALAFAIIGHIYDQTHNRWLPDLGGLMHQVPFLAGCGILAAMASSGLPGLANFVAELLVFLGGWDRYPMLVVGAVFGIVITAIYMLRFVRGIFFGERRPEWDKVTDAAGLQRVPFLLLAGALLFAGIWPRPFLQRLDSATRPLARVYEEAMSETEKAPPFTEQAALIPEAGR